MRQPCSLDLVVEAGQAADIDERRRRGGATRRRRTARWRGRCHRSSGRPPPTPATPSSPTDRRAASARRRAGSWSSPPGDGTRPRLAVAPVRASGADGSGSRGGSGPRRRRRSRATGRPSPVRGHAPLHDEHRQELADVRPAQLGTRDPLTVGTQLERSEHGDLQPRRGLDRQTGQQRGRPSCEGGVSGHRRAPELLTDGTSDVIDQPARERHPVDGTETVQPASELDGPWERKDGQHDSRDHRVRAPASPDGEQRSSDITCPRVRWSERDRVPSGP